MGVEPAIDITAEQRRTILTLLKRHLPCTTVWVYGSRAKWTSQPHSDLDMVVFATPDQSSRVSLLREAFEDSDLPFRVDLFVWNEVPDSFWKQIESDHVVLATPGGKEPGALDGWQDTNLGALIELKRGYDLPKRVRKPGSVPIVSSSGVTGHHSESKVTGPGVVTGRYGTLGQVFYIADDFWPLNTTLYVRDFKESDPRFIRYLLQDLDFSVYSDKAAVPGLNRNHLHQEPVRVPSDPSEQRAIAHILGTLDEKIDLNRRMNETLESMARAIFKDWFVDFGPSRVKAEGRDPYVAPEIWDLFPDALDKQGKPLGWIISEIGNEVDAVGGTTPSTKEPSYWEGGEYHWATPKDLSKLSSPVLMHTDRKITEAGVRKISSGLLPVGTVLMSSRAPIGYLAIVEVPTAVNQGFIAMVCEKRLPNVFVLFWCYENLDYIKGISGGSTFSEISKRVFRPIPVVVPPERIVKAFEWIIRPLYSRIVANVRESESLAQTRDLLLPKLMSGEIRLSDAENAVEAVA